MIQYIDFILIEDLLLEISIKKSFTCKNLNSNLISLGPGNFTICDKNLCLVIICTVSVELLSLRQILRPLIVSGLIIIEVVEDTPLWRRWYLIKLWFLEFLLIILDKINGSFDGSIGFLVIAEILLFLKVSYLILYGSLTIFFNIVSRDNFDEFQTGFSLLAHGNINLWFLLDLHWKYWHILFFHFLLEKLLKPFSVFAKSEYLYAIISLSIVLQVIILVNDFISA